MLEKPPCTERVKNIYAGAAFEVLVNLCEFFLLHLLILKLMKPVRNPKSYQLIALLYVPYKILMKLIYACIKPISDLLLLREQAGFRCRKSTVDQVILLTENIKDFLLIC